ncbi:roadblock/LC7 domain-containing protein [Streptomyces microflavus]|uniref:roadblock/LC7 domain-containing protein n=1 Tax=Streptomyces microflavus TaxID=1919 RepID=UPI00380DACF0
MNGLTTNTSPQLAWTIGELQNLQGVDTAIVTTSDGLLITHSEAISRDQADKLAAAVSGMYSLGRAASEFVHDRSLGQIGFEYEGAMILVTAVGHARNALIAATTLPGADTGVVGENMASMAPSIARQLDVADRSPSAGPTVR